MARPDATIATGRQRRRAGLPALLVVLLLAGLAAVATPAQARVIGIVYDDSGSMARQINTAALAIQLLVATLDGRDRREGSDRLITLRLSDAERVVGRNRAGEPAADPPVDAVTNALRARGLLGARPIGPNDLQATVTEMRDTLSTAEGGTPYIAVEVMLRAIAQELGSEETGHLIIITDGVFDPAPPGHARQFSAFEEVRRRLDAKTARITVDFLALGLQRPETFFREIDGQCVRPLLLSMFNGAVPVPPANACADPAIRSSPGYHNLRSVAEIPPALEGIAAAISGTDRNIAARYIRREGAVVTIDSPLSITRIVSMAGANQPQNPPAVASTSFTPTGRFAVTSEMARADSAAPSVRQTGVTTQFFFDPSPLQAGAHTLTYDRPVAEDVRFVFQTAARVVLRLRTGAAADSPLVEQDSAGRYRVLAGRNYVFEAIIEDEKDGRPVNVPFDSLRGPVRFRVAIDAAGQARQFSPLTARGDRATDDFRRAVPGELIARADAAIEGFLTLTSRPVRIVVIDDPKLGLKVEPAERCADDCPPNTLTATFDDRTGQRPVGRVTLSTGSRQPVRGTFDRSGLPDWISVIGPDNQPIAPGATITVPPGRPLALELRREGRSCAGVAGAEAPYRLAFTPEGGLPAPAPVEGALRVRTNDNPQLRFVRAEGRTVDGTLTRSLFELPRAEGGLVFEVSGFCAPPEPGEITASLPQAWFTSLAARGEGTTRTFTPQTSWWCACLAVFDWGRHTVTVSYLPPGRTTPVTATAPADVVPEWWEGLACLVVLLLVIWLSIALLVAYRAERFVKGAVIEIREGSQLPRHNDLRGRNWTLFKAMLWPLRGFSRDFLPHERYRGEGLEFTARRNGATITISPDMTDFELRGQRISEQLDINPKLTRMPVNWREEIEIPGSPRVQLRLLRSMQDASNA